MDELYSTNVVVLSATKAKMIEESLLAEKYKAEAEEARLLAEKYKAEAEEAHKSYKKYKKQWKKENTQRKKLEHILHGIKCMIQDCETIKILPAPTIGELLTEQDTVTSELLTEQDAVTSELLAEQDAVTSVTLDDAQKLVSLYENRFIQLKYPGKDKETRNAHCIYRGISVKGKKNRI